MRLLFLLFVLCFTCFECTAQALDSNINVLASEIAAKVFSVNKVKLALTDFVNADGKVDALTAYIREELELKLINSSYNLQTMDRKHIKQLLAEHHLQSEGLIDESTAKSSISFIKVDGWVNAEIVNIDGKAKIKVTVTDISTSLIYAAASSKLISDQAIKELLDPSCPLCKGAGVLKNESGCNVCDGKGSMTCDFCKGLGGGECSQCDGSGKHGSISPTRGIYEIPDCSKCKGTGRAACSNCSGKGIKKCNTCGGKKQISSSRTCVKCNGTGKK